MSSPQRRSPGFTLVEVMVAIVITGVVSISLAQMLQVGQRSADRNRILSEMQQNVRVGMQSVSDDLRHVSYGKDPTQPSIYYAGPDSVDFVADLMADHPGAERVQYFLSPDGDPDTPNPDDTVLMKVVRDTTGTELFRSPQAYGIARDGLAFRWFNGGGVEMANPVPQPEQVGEILVTLTSAASREMSGTYPDMTLSSTIYPRNLPLSPARSRPSTPSCSPLTFPNCESATLAWTTPTTNTDGTALPLSEISHFALYFGTDPDHLDLYTKLARTIEQWTIPGLVDGAVYYLAVTCVSRSGVESYRCGQEADMSSPLVPLAPASLTVAPLAAAVLSWGAVTHFTTGVTITTPVSYCVYRDVAAGFTAAAANRIATVTATTTYTDTTGFDCSTYFYRVQAKACGNEGAGSNEVSKSLPAPPAAPTGLTASQGAATGSAVLHWPPINQRTDGSLLPPEAIQTYKIYADTFPSQETYFTEITAPADSAVLTGLDACRTWFLNMRAVDQCGHDGAYLTTSAAPVFLVGDCDAAVPVAPATLGITAADDRVQLQWNANTTDCDLAGYRIYYGGTAGSYGGTFAAEGPSPVTVTTDAVTLGSVCRAELSGLGTCQQVFAVVKAIDRCSPLHESAASPEADGTTTCVACEVSDVCSAWAADQTNQAVHLEVWSSNSGGETITRVIPTFGSSALVREIWYGRPLVKIWAGDGSAGQDGAIGDQPSGTTLNVTDAPVPTWADQADGQTMMVLFDSAMNGVPLEMRFQGNSGFCTVNNTPSTALWVDGFEDSYTGWTSIAGSGTWSVTGGELAQSNSASSTFLITKDGLTGLGALTMEGKVKVTGGGYRSLYLAFRVQNSSNYYLFGIRTDTDKVLVDRMKSNTFSTLTSSTVSLNDNQWYNLRVQVSGGPANVNIKGWIDCTQVVNYTDTQTTWATGMVGVATRRGLGRFDDLRFYAGAVLP